MWAGVFYIWYIVFVFVVALLQGGLIMRLTCHIIARAFRRWIGTQIKFRPCSTCRPWWWWPWGPWWRYDCLHVLTLTQVVEVSERCIQIRQRTFLKQKVQTAKWSSVLLIVRNWFYGVVALPWHRLTLTIRYLVLPFRKCIISELQTPVQWKESWVRIWKCLLVSDLL